MSLTKVKKRRLGTLALFCLPLLVLSIQLGWRPLAAWQSAALKQSSDPDNIVRAALMVAETGNVYVTVDPPLRYLPLAAVFAFVNPTAETAARITQSYATAMSFVVLPLTVSITFWRVADWETGFLTFLGFGVWRALGITENAYYDGFWHYTFVLPLVFVVFLSLHETVRRRQQGPEASLLAACTGLGIGLIGLNQYVYAALVATTVTLVYLYHGYYREFLITGVVGAVSGTPLLFVRAETRSFIADSAISRLGIDRWSLQTVLTGVVDVFTTPSYLLFFLLAVFLGIWIVVSPYPISETAVVGAAIGVFGLVGIVCTLLVYPRWFAQLSFYVFQYLVLGTLVQQSISIVTASRPRFWERSIELFTSSPGRIRYAVWALTWLGFSLLVLLAVPLHAP